MRRKSERNKAKGSPEKKVEKATRKSTRRRRKSPSTSPEPEVENEEGTSTVALQEESDKSASSVPKSEIIITQAAEEEKLGTGEEADTGNQSAEEEENNGSVWKVARADASPGEIQKLKLCRQRNISEASSDNSVERKRSSKWRESGGEGVAEEDDSADEPPLASAKADSSAWPAADDADEPCSRRPSRRSSDQEVSDSKETPPETTSANLSDDMQHADRQREQSQQADSKPVANDDEQEQQTDEEPRLELATEEVVVNESPKETPVESTNETVEGEVTAEVEAASRDNEDAAVSMTESRMVETSVISIDIGSTEIEEERESAGKDSESSDEEKSGRRSDSSSNTGEVSDEKGRAKIRSSITTTRRKHRSKYRDSSESNESEDERADGKMKNKNHVREEASPRKNDEFEECNDKKKMMDDEQMDGEDIMRREDDEEEGNREKNRDKSWDDSCEKENKREDDRGIEKNAQTSHKPMKVNLKRSFTHVSDFGGKKDSDDKMDRITTENKENCAIESKSAPKRRRWGTTITSDITPTFSVSTDTLKALVPEAKPLSLNEVRLSKEDDVDRLKSRDRKHSLNNSDDNEMSKKDNGKRTETLDNHIGKRKISIVKDSHISSPSPPTVKPTNILLIQNLVRPFTLNQIKELLSRTGQIVENGFWMDRIKSKCYVEYSNEDQAFETRQALHGISWPLSNPKKLQVEYATKEDMQQARESCKDQPVSRKAEAVSVSDTWQQGWSQDEKNNSTKITVVREWDLGKEDGQVHLKEKEREKKDDKKRRQRSVSPNVEARLPPPARKFKKKEDDPPPAKLLDDLFRKTKATPCIYWLPLTNEQIAIKKEMRRQHMAEHARRLEEMRRVERNRDRDRRRRSPRK